MNPSGNGLGMYISRNICRALGGDLTVNSKLNTGSSFTMTMDVKQFTKIMNITLVKSTDCRFKRQTITEQIFTDEFL